MISVARASYKRCAADIVWVNLHKQYVPSYLDIGITGPGITQRKSRRIILSPYEHVVALRFLQADYSELLHVCSYCVVFLMDFMLPGS